ncbi:MAG TPA: biotin--[acetyl-CoA-carboxylase] ligase [Persephonella sp.]|nr:biotin--[acetyl-CoA-carboxylase] ligase [Hydrogenothermaceae bacterium]HIQ25236.1 biotin--[acetyl-CoA-carboxylase] ligase [Persephonella sp.]
MDNIDLQILQILDGNTVSGEILAKNFNLSRTAIWKRIKKLESLGYKFEHKKEGYKLVEKSPYLLENEVRPYLKTKLIGKNYIWFKTLNSSNTFAKENNLEEGTIVVAEQQTAGKGRKGRKWVSLPIKGIYFSIVLKPKITIDKLLQISLLFPLAIRKTIENFGVNAHIKWPNDIYINGKKVSGTLIETNIELSDIEKLIVGIGINVNYSKEDFKEIKNIATSLLIEKGRPINRKNFFGELLNRIEDYYFKFLEEKINPVKEVDKYLLWKGKKVKIIDDEKIYEGIFKGLNEYGGIKLEINGKEKNFYTGDLSLRIVK